MTSTSLGGHPESRQTSPSLGGHPQFRRTSTSLGGHPRLSVHAAVREVLAVVGGRLLCERERRLGAVVVRDDVRIRFLFVGASPRPTRDDGRDDQQEDDDPCHTEDDDEDFDGAVLEHRAALRTMAAREVADTVARQRPVEDAAHAAIVARRVRARPVTCEHTFTVLGLLKHGTRNEAEDALIKMSNPRNLTSSGRIYKHGSIVTRPHFKIIGGVSTLDVTT